MFEPVDRVSKSRPYALACWVLCALLAAQLLGQAVQRFSPRDYLPPLQAFQGMLPYWLSLGVEGVVVIAMASISWRLCRGRLVPNQRLGSVLGWIAAGYLVVNVMRIGFGLAFPEAHPWFRMWIPAVTHVVLASFMLIFSLYHRREEPPHWQ
jgi:hypothetical protein